MERRAMIDLALRVLHEVQAHREPNWVDMQVMRNMLPQFDHELEADELACELIRRLATQTAR